MSAIELSEVAKRFGATRVLSDIDLVVPDGSITAVLGASGSGKTTLLRLIAGFARVDGGTVSIGGQVLDDGRQFVRPQHRAVGFVPQEGALFPHLTVSGNIGFGVGRARRRHIGELVDLVGLSGMEHRYPHQLSGGQQQRVALARALAIRPKVVLLDEPFSSLDATLRDAVRSDVARILADTGTTTVLVTHDQDEALALADQVALLHQGVILAVDDPRTLYGDPPDVETAVSIGDANIVRAEVHGDLATCVLGEVSVRPPGTGSRLILLRPEQLEVHREGEGPGIAAVVGNVQYHGHDALVHLVTSGTEAAPLVARIPGDVALVAGQHVRVEVRGPARTYRESDT